MSRDRTFLLEAIQERCARGLGYTAGMRFEQFTKDGKSYHDGSHSRRHGT